jgi:predicted glycosyltransferase involved in capsule biosynthesis
MLKIIIPYRNREKHLKIFLENLSHFTKENTEVFIIEQIDDKPFNRGKLLNIGFLESSKIDINNDYIYCFHDVDFIPNLLNIDINYYEKFKNFRHPYGVNNKDFEGFGVIAFTNKESFLKVNGYPNNYWGWGREDDCLLSRIRYFGLDVNRDNFIHRMKSKELEHGYENKDYYWRKNNELFQLERNNRDLIKTNGINNIEYIIESNEKQDNIIKIKVAL